MPSFQQCDFCEQSIPAGSTICPLCGHVQKSAAEWRRHSRSILLAIVLSIAVMVAWTMLSHHT